jgi:hypothetical protein
LPAGAREALGSALKKLLRTMQGLFGAALLRSNKRF